MTKSRILFLLLLIAVAMLIPLTSYDISIQVRDSEKQATPQAYPFGIQLKPVIPEAHALDIINDDFASGLNGWTYGAIPRYSQCSGYYLYWDTGTGSPAPSGRVSGNNYSCYAAMKKTASLSGWTYPTPLYLSFSWRAYSGYYYSTVTNMALYIYDGSTYLYGYTLISGGAYDTGWRNWNPTNIASNVAGHSSITIYFQLVDAWSYNWNQQIWADNVRLSYTPPTASITITSNPLGPGYVAVDGSPISTPQTYPWTVGSTHTLGATSPVSCGSGCQYAWSSWSDGGAQTHAITVPSIIVIDDFASTAGWYFNRISASASGGILTGTITGGDPYMWKDIQDFSGSSYPYVIIRMSVNSPGTSSAQIFWVNEQGGWSETRSQHFNVINDGAFYVYTIDLRSNANWNGRTIQWFRLDPSDQGSSGTFQVDYIYAASAPTTYTASFKRQYQLTMAVNPAGAGTTNPAVGSYWYDSGQSVPISASAASGYVFQSWSGGGSGSYSGSSNPATVTMNGPISETANFQLNTVTITFQLNGIGSDATGIIITIDGTGYTYSQFPRSFIWSVGSTHTVAAADSVAAGTGKQYDWTSWTNGDGLSGPSGTYTTPSSSQTVTANYETQYQLTVNSAYDSPNPRSGWFNAGTSMTASVSSPVSGPSGTRYVCAGWTGAGSVPASGTGTSVTFTMNARSSITWNWKTQYQLTMQVDPSGSGSASPAIGSYWYDAGSSVPISATAASGYVFQSWVGSGTGSYSGTENSASITMSDPITETAKFVVQVTMTVSYSVLERGTPTAPVFNYVQGGVSKQYTLTTTATAISVDSGSTWSVTPNPLSGSGASERWYSSQTLSGTASTTTTLFTFHHQHLQILSYALSGDGSGYSEPTFMASRNGASAPQVLTTSATDYWYDAGAPWTVTNPLDGSGGSERWYTAQTTSGTISAAQTVVFNYRHQFKLTIQVNDPPMGITSPAPGEYWYDFGATQPVTATPTSGNQLSHWELDGSNVGSANPYTITINMAHTLTAVFEKQKVDHFIISEISSPQTVGVAFTITITAVDAAGQTVAGYTGPNTLTDTTGTITPTSITFTGGVWTGSVTITKAQTGVTITTTGNGKTGISNSFDVSSVYQVTITATGIGPDALGAVFTVDGVTYLNSQVPIILSWQAGTDHTVEAAQSVTSSVGGKCYNWDRWVSGGSARVLQITANSPLTLTASFETQYLLSAYSVPPGAQITRAPASADGFYDPGTTVQLTAAGNNGGVAFTMWLLNGVPQPKGQTTLTVVMTQPFVALAMYESPKQQQGITISAYDPIVAPVASILIIAAALVGRRRRRQ